MSEFSCTFVESIDYSNPTLSTEPKQQGTKKIHTCKDMDLKSFFGIKWVTAQIPKYSLGVKLTQFL